jgi:predicted RNase H-like HicB family nuclease
MKKAHDFEVSLEPDETGGYVAICPSLPGCYSQGETLEEAMENIEEAILLCLEDGQATESYCRTSPKLPVRTQAVDVKEQW